MSPGFVSESDARALLKKALTAAGRRVQAEATLGGGRLELTRFANNQIHQNMSEEWPSLALRLVAESAAGIRTARASTSRLDARGLAALAKHARALLAVAAPRKDALPLARAADNPPAEAFDAATAEAGPALRADACGRVVLPSRRRGLTSAGFYATQHMSIGDYGGAQAFAIMNTAGLFAYHASTRAHFSATAMTDDSSGWVDAESHAAAGIDTTALGAIAIDKAERTRRPIAGRSGPTNVVLEPHAVAALLRFLLGAFSAQAVQEGRSYLVDRIGQRVLGANINLTDDVRHPLLRGRPWDGEGVPTRRVELVKAGVPSNLVYSRREARDAPGVEPTGHGPDQPSTAGSAPRHVVMTGGSASIDDLVRQAGEGVLVTRLWYNRMVDGKRVRVTGMTRDGTISITGGRLGVGLKNMRYNVAVPDILNNVVAMSKPVRAGGMVVPALLVTGFEFTSSTRF